MLWQVGFVACEQFPLPRPVQGFQRQRYVAHTNAAIIEAVVRVPRAIPGIVLLDIEVQCPIVPQKAPRLRVGCRGRVSCGLDERRQRLLRCAWAVKRTVKERARCGQLVRRARSPTYRRVERPRNPA